MKKQRNSQPKSTPNTGDGDQFAIRAAVIALCTAIGLALLASEKAAAQTALRPAPQLTGSTA